jgi:hypothetical protein
VICWFFILPVCVATGDIGGLMGIFLGASLLSLVELMEFFLLLLKPGNKLKTEEAPVVENGAILHEAGAAAKTKKNAFE